MGAVLSGQEPEPGSPLLEYADYFFGIWVVENDLARTTLRFIGPKNRMCLLASTISMRTGDAGKVYGQCHLGTFEASFLIINSPTMDQYYSLRMEIKKLDKWQRGIRETTFVEWATDSTTRTYDLLRGVDGKVVLRDTEDAKSEWTLRRRISGLGLNHLGGNGRAYVDGSELSSPGEKMTTVALDGEECTFIVPGEDTPHLFVLYVPRHSPYLKPDELMSDDEFDAKIIIGRNMVRYIRLRKSLTKKEWDEKVNMQMLLRLPAQRRRRKHKLVYCMEQC